MPVLGGGGLLVFALHPGGDPKRGAGSVQPSMGPLPRNGALERLVSQRFGPKAQSIIQILHLRPGLNIEELARALGVQRTAANHHVRILEREGILVRVRQARHQLHFAGDTTPLEREVLCLLRIASVQRVVRALFEGQPPTGDTLGPALGLTGRTARRALRLLNSRGLLRVENGADGARRAHLHPTIRLLLARVPGTPDAP